MPNLWRRNVDEFYRGLLRLARQTGTALAGGDLSRAERLTIDITVCGVAPRGAALRRDGAKPGETVYVSGALGRAASRGYRDKPQPRLLFGRRLRGRASACMDLSDGLSIDLYRLCEASGVSVNLTHVPVAGGASLDDALHGGEDYELVYTGPPGLPGIAVGVVTALAPGALVMFEGLPLAISGHDHFAYNSRH